MIIRSAHGDYFVTQVLTSSKDVSTYLATELTTRKNTYLVNEFSNTQAISTHIADLLTLKESGSLNSLISIFTQNSKLYTFFKYHEPHTLSDFLAKYSLSFPDKLKLFTKYLFQLATTNKLPLLLQCSLTDLDNINVYGDESIYFNYSIKSKFACTKSSKSALFQSLAELVRIVFAKELSGKYSRKLQVVLDKCEKGIYSSVPQMIKDFEDIDTRSSWEKLKAKFQEEKERYLQRIKDIALILGLVLIVYITYTQFIASSAVPALGGPQRTIEHIGDVHIDQHSLSVSGSGLEENSESDTLDIPYNPEEHRTINITVE